MYYLYTISSYLPNFIMNIVTAVVGVFIKRDDKVYLFGSKCGVGFGGNVRNMFQYLTENKDKYLIKKIIYVTRSKALFKELSYMGYEVYMMHSIKSYYYHLKAGRHVCSGSISNGFAAGKYNSSDILSRLSLGAKHFYLHHHMGAGKSNMMIRRKQIKGLRRAIIEGYRLILSLGVVRHFVLYPGGWDDMVFCVSCKRDLIEQQVFFEYHPIKYRLTCFCELLPPAKYLPSEMEVIRRFPKDRTLVLYVPVFRTKKTGYVNPLNDKEFVEFLEKESFFWIQKLNHEDSAMEADDSVYSSPAILKLQASFDINIISSFIDIQVTDYSSARMKAIALDKPVIYYVPDQDIYNREDKGIDPVMEDAINKNRADSIGDLCNRLLEARCSDNFFTIERKKEYLMTKSLQMECMPSAYSYDRIYRDIFESEAN